MEAPPQTVWTVGHSSRSWDEFLALLLPESIELIVDVRRFVGSRKHPQFGGERLPRLLGDADIEYTSIVELGGRRKPSGESTNTIWKNAAFRAYADYMDTDEYRAGRELLLERARRQRTAILCSEAVWWRCHRSMIADDLKSRGHRAVHIMGAGKLQEHPYTAPASIRDGKLYYGAAPPEA